MEFLKHLLASLPSRVSAIEDTTTARFQSPRASLSFAQALVASACSSNLQTVSISSHLLTPAAADVILRGLPQLQQASLAIHMPYSGGGVQAEAPNLQVWRPAADCSGLLSLVLRLKPFSYNDYDSSWIAVLDLSGLSSATKLQRLAISPASRPLGLQSCPNWTPSRWAAWSLMKLQTQQQ
jgi:hypothetical protein